MWYSGRWQMVTLVIDEAQVPTGRRYHVVCEETNEFWLEYDPVLDYWQVKAVTGTGT